MFFVPEEEEQRSLLFSFNPLGRYLEDGFQHLTISNATIVLPFYLDSEMSEEYNGRFVAMRLTSQSTTQTKRFRLINGPLNVLLRMAGIEPRHSDSCYRKC
ncbi:hypothetical protein NPIL_43751 [Nephila pilipes]|uniref:Uncharacterized protein n=1 Tax=Nephila pilipes TaxID=299642 RepID=A0A8X6NWB1_NEPPI|nr:hypothetical protein NPIL_43751 [Nephila pilipes]